MAPKPAVAGATNCDRMSAGTDSCGRSGICPMLRTGSGTVSRTRQVHRGREERGGKIQKKRSGRGQGEIWGRKAGKKGANADPNEVGVVGKDGRSCRSPAGYKLGEQRGGLPKADANANPLRKR